MGTVVISLDMELGWGFHDRSLPEERLRNARENCSRLRRLFDSYDVPATWAITGHLFLDSCTERHLGHPADERCCTRSAGALSPHDVWFGPDLVDEIATASVDHELASHGFTHVHFQHECVDAEFASRELAHCADAGARRGFDLTSFVFPVNRVRYRDRLAEHGFGCYRGVNPARLSKRPWEFQARKLSSAALGKPTPPIVEPHLDEYGLVNVPASLYLFNIGRTYGKYLSVMGEDPVVRQAKAGIDRVAETDGVLHLWLHPHDIRTARHHDRLASIVRYLDRKRETSDVRVETMAEIADSVRREADVGVNSTE
ncbi:polysaccharide deacetylase [Natronoglomus mannanivorans]|uniref:Polysaccharide deacetylase n=1 Tax=Natronoglomus mannanivorans TaxID=2979990 RepID=A0AAP2Z159_9EURY|nr:polysaccharide deacetylase [Halobacteria archaeon AArc-xg1-1]